MVGRHTMLSRGSTQARSRFQRNKHLYLYIRFLVCIFTLASPEHESHFFPVNHYRSIFSLGINLQGHGDSTGSWRVRWYVVSSMMAREGKTRHLQIQEPVIFERNVVMFSSPQPLSAWGPVSVITGQDILKLSRWRLDISIAGLSTEAPIIPWNNNRKVSM